VNANICYRPRLQHTTRLWASTAKLFDLTPSPPIQLLVTPPFLVRLVQGFVGSYSCFLSRPEPRTTIQYDTTLALGYPLFIFDSSFDLPSILPCSISSVALAIFLSFSAFVIATSRLGLRTPQRLCRHRQGTPTPTEHWHDEHWQDVVPNAGPKLTFPRKLRT